ncbi:MAG: diguanylate cyclase [Anaerolineaceae bacterium]|nr:diguanylate cyclase [Anaerolineaceae bacterium]
MSDASQYEKLQQRKQLIEKTNHLIQSVMQSYQTNPLEAYEKASIAYHISVSGPFLQEPYLVGMADSLHAMSKINLQWKKLGLALAQAQNSQKIAEMLNNEVIILQNTRIIAEVYFLLNNMEKANELFCQILQYPNNDQSKLIEVEAIQFLTQIALLRHDLNTARAHILKSIDLCTQYKFDEQLGYSYLLYGRICLADGEFNKASQTITRAMELSQQDRYPLIYAQSLDLLGTLNISTEKYTEAELNFSLMASYALRQKLEESYLQALLGICLVNKATGNEKTYIDTLKEMHALPYLDQHHELQSKVDLLLSQNLENKKKYKNALQHFKKYHTVQLSWLRKQHADNLQALEAIHQTEMAMSEVELVDDINEKLNAEIQERKWAEKQLRKSEAKFRNLAVIDSLTGLYNRHHFYQIGQQEVERATRFDLPLSLLMMDIDHYKSINDNFGHRAGDFVLSHLGILISKAIRKIDIACRYGGEEFVILLPETDLEQAKNVAERIRSSIMEKPVTYEGNEIQVTASIGIVSRKKMNTTVEDLLGLADDAMYQAKEKGRNQVIIST